MLDLNDNIFLIDLDGITFKPKEWIDCLPTRAYAPCNIFIKIVIIGKKKRMFKFLIINAIIH